MVIRTFMAKVVLSFSAIVLTVVMVVLATPIAILFEVYDFISEILKAIVKGIRNYATRSKKGLRETHNALVECINSMYEMIKNFK